MCTEEIRFQTSPELCEQMFYKMAIWSHPETIHCDSTWNHWVNYFITNEKFCDSTAQSSIVERYRRYEWPQRVARIIAWQEPTIWIFTLMLNGRERKEQHFHLVYNEYATRTFRAFVYEFTGHYRASTLSPVRSVRMLRSEKFVNVPGHEVEEKLVSSRLFVVFRP